MEENENMIETVETAQSNESYDVETAQPNETSADETAKVDTNAESIAPRGEKSSKFADYRRREELEQYRTQASELQAKTGEYEQEIAGYKERERRLNELLGNYYEGDSIEDKIMTLEAQIRGVSVADIKAEKAQNEAVQRAEKEQADELAYYKSIAEQAQREKAQSMYDADLKAVQELDANVKSLEELGEEFVNLRFTKNPLTGEYYSVAEVYNHLKSKIKPLPQTSGTVNTAAEGNKEIDFSAIPTEEFEKIYNKIVYGS